MLEIREANTMGPMILQTTVMMGKLTTGLAGYIEDY